MNDIAPVPQPEREASATVTPAVSVVVTLYNEEDNVEPMVRNLLSAFQEVLTDRSFELVLVLNGSLDKTPERAKLLAQELPQIKLVELAVNQGYGGGILAGLAVARGGVVGYTDADEQISASDAARVFEAALSGNFDLVKAVRSKREDGWQRLIVSAVYNQLFGIMFGACSKDINAKPKVFKREAYNRLNLQSKDWFIDAEAMIQARRNGFSVQELPIVFKPRQHGSSNVRFATIIEFLKNMWKYRDGQR